MLALGELRAIVPFLPNPHLLTFPFLRREAILSSKIEGTHTELEQLYLFESDKGGLKEQQDVPGFRDAHEVHNYVVALEYGLEQLNTVPICNRLLKAMHEKLLDGVARDRGKYKNPGQFRKDQAYIGSLDIASARYVAPPADRIEELMADLEQYVHTTVKYHPTLVRIAILHYQFEAIHPFSDGNGRIGRMLISLLLAAWDVLPQPLLYLSAYFEKHLDTYRQRLWHVSCDADWIGWVRFFVQGVYEEARDAAGRAKRVLDLRERYRQTFQRPRGSSSALTLVDSLFQTPFVTVQAAADLLAVTYNSGKKTVDKLVDAGILFEYTNRPWNRVYYAKAIFELLR